VDEHSSRERYKRSYHSRRILLSPGRQIKCEAKHNEKCSQRFGPGIGDVFHNHWTQRKQHDQWKDSYTASSRDRGHNQAARQENEEIQRNENHLKQFVTVLRLCQKIRGDDVHQRWPRGKCVDAEKRCVRGKSPEKEKRALKVFQPIAGPVRAGIHANHCEQEESPDEQEGITQKGVAYARAT